MLRDRFPRRVLTIDEVRRLKACVDGTSMNRLSTRSGVSPEIIRNLTSGGDAREEAIPRLFAIVRRWETFGKI